MNNAEIANNGEEFYAHRIFELADQYIMECLNGDAERFKEYFRDAVIFIRDRLEVPGHEDIEGLDALFNGYLRLCTRYKKLPTLELFSFLAKTNPATFTDWMNGEYRSGSSHSKTTKKWKDICRGFAVDELSNNNFANPNLIFVAKSAYGLRETSPIPAEQPRPQRWMSMDELPVLGEKSTDRLPELGEELSENNNGFKAE